MLDRLQTTRATGAAATTAVVVRIVSGLVFVVFGIGKFAAHAHEVESFRDYGLPSPDLFVYAIGAIELCGGVLLLLGLLTRVAAVVLAGNMIGAISTAGPVEGGPINFGLAPALLIAMVYLLWAGPGPRSIDERMRTARTQSAP